MITLGELMNCLEPGSTVRVVLNGKVCKRHEVEGRAWDSKVRTISSNLESTDHYGGKILESVITIECGLTADELEKIIRR